MYYTPGVTISFEINKKPPYVHVTIKPGISRTYTVGSKVILNQLITQITESVTIPVLISS